MDGRLLILCDENITLNSSNERIDKDGNILIKMQDGSYEDKDLNKVEVDEHKNIISAIDLIMPMETQSTQNSDMLFVDWETVVPEDIEYLQKLVSYSMTIEQLPPEIIQEGMKQKNSLMKRAHEEVFYAIQNERPSIDYRFIAMDTFMRSLYDMMQQTRIVTVLPAYCKQTDVSIKQARQRTIDSFKYQNDTLSKIGRQDKIKILDPIEYEKFGEVYLKAQDEMMKIYSAPDWYDSLNSGMEIGE